MPKILENYPSVLQLEYQIHASVGWYVHIVYTNTHIAEVKNRLS